MIYEIKVKGRLDESWSDWLGNVQITPALAEDGTWGTTLLAEAPDPPALFGILDRIRDLNLTLIALREVSGEEISS